MSQRERNAHCVVVRWQHRLRSSFVSQQQEASGNSPFLRTILVIEIAEARIAMTMPTGRAYYCCVIVLLTVAAAGARELPALMRLTERPHMSTCACEDPTLCAPVSKQHQREVFGFGASGEWQKCVPLLAHSASPLLPRSYCL